MQLFRSQFSCAGFKTECAVIERHAERNIERAETFHDLAVRMAISIVLPCRDDGE